MRGEGGGGGREEGGRNGEGERKKERIGRKLRDREEGERGREVGRG